MIVYRIKVSGTVHAWGPHPREPYLSMREQVSDMLRYDSAREDEATFTATPETGSSYRFTVEMDAYGFTPARWASFGFKAEKLSHSRVREKDHKAQCHANYIRGKVILARTTDTNYPCPCMDRYTCKAHCHKNPCECEV